MAHSDRDSTPVSDSPETSGDQFGREIAAGQRFEFGKNWRSYLNVLNDTEKLEDENPAIGIILCSEKNDRTVEYAFQKISNPMGVAVYQLSEQLPEHLKNILPDPESLKRLLG